MNTKQVLAISALAAAVPLAAAAPGSGQGQGSVSLVASPTVVIFGGSTGLGGEARGGSGENAPVRLQADPFPFEGTFTDAGSGTTDANGRFGFRAAPRVNTRYRAVVNNRESREVLVQVRVRVVGGVSDATPRRGQFVRFSGTVRPAHDGAEARIQRRGADRRYRTIARTRLRDAGDERSRYARGVRIRRSGVYRVLVIPADGDHVEGVTRPRRLRVHG